MLFNSIEYVIFLPIVLFVCFSVPASFRWLVLLVASYVFYMAWMPAYLALILLSTTIDYVAGLAIGRTTTRRTKRFWLLASLTLNLGLLFAFKYYGFFAESAERLAQMLGMNSTSPALDLLLPVGISFYTFQTLSYTFEVYRDNQQPERHFGRFALYVAFFPQLVAGPIERPGHLLPQLRSFQFDYALAVSGMRLILWGLFKKMVIADRLAQIADRVYAAPQDFTGPALTAATLAFSFQILCDFSAYTDIAIGSARLFGVDLMQNFRRPYAARSIREFWQRWHISLSTWFRDYVYVPLGGNRVAVPRHYVNILITFALSGLWHGANWTFVLWGIYHGALYVAGESTRGLREKLARSIGLPRVPALTSAGSIMITFVLVCIGWILFRAESLDDAAYVLASLGSGWSTFISTSGPAELLQALRCSRVDLSIVLLGLLLMGLGEYLRFREDSAKRLARVPRLLRWAAYLGLAFAVTYFGVRDEVAFIYFQF